MAGDLALDDLLKEIEKGERPCPVYCSFHSLARWPPICMPHEHEGSLRYNQSERPRTGVVRMAFGGIDSGGLRQYDPDVVCLQEVSIRQQTPVYSQARSVAQAVGFEHSVFTPTAIPRRSVSRDQGGIAVLSRWRILDARTRRLPSSRHESFDARAAIFALVDAPEGPLGLITTHLSWRPDEPELRLMQLGLLLKELDRGRGRASGPRSFLRGDLNGTPDEPAIHAGSREASGFLVGFIRGSRGIPGVASQSADLRSGPRGPADRLHSLLQRGGRVELPGDPGQAGARSGVGSFRGFCRAGVGLTTLREPPHLRSDGDQMAIRWPRAPCRLA